ncbi:separase [Hordeum vulgare]|nr:separase [Hordeum vulgare]
MTTLRGCSTADDLIAALSSPSSRAGLHSRFAAYLQPFCPTCPPRTLPNTPPKRATKQAKQPQQQPPPPGAAVVRPLAKRFRPFLFCVLQLLLPLLRPNPSGAGDAEGLGVRCGGTSSLHPLVDTGAGASGRRNLDLVLSEGEVGKRNLDLVSSERRGGEKRRVLVCIEYLPNPDVNEKQV